MRLKEYKMTMRKKMEKVVQIKLLLFTKLLVMYSKKNLYMFLEKEKVCNLIQVISSMNLVVVVFFASFSSNEKQNQVIYKEEKYVI